MDQLLTQELPVSLRSVEDIMTITSETVSLTEAKDRSNLIKNLFGVFDPDWITNYSELKPCLRTGDIILVHGKYPFSWVVQLLQWSQWGHSAMVVLRSDVDPGNQWNLPEIMLWESNTGGLGVTNVWGNSRGQVKEGPMLISLEERLISTATNPDYRPVRIVHRPLYMDSHNQLIDFSGLPAFFDSMMNRGFPSDAEIIYSVYLGRKYNRTSNNPTEGLELIKLRTLPDPTLYSIELKNADDALINVLSATDIDKSNIYCSELIAATYKHLGLLTGFHVSNAYAPKDFSANGRMALLNRAWLGDEMYIDMTK